MKMESHSASSLTAGERVEETEARLRSRGQLVAARDRALAHRQGPGREAGQRLDGVADHDHGRPGGRPLADPTDDIVEKIRIFFLAAPAEQASLWLFGPPVVHVECKSRLLRCQIQWGIVAGGSKSCPGRQKHRKSDSSPHLVQGKIMRNIRCQSRRPSGLPDGRDEAGEACRRRR